jgi:hypothetical protein
VKLVSLLTCGYLVNMVLKSLLCESLLLITPLCANLIVASGAETVSHEAILFDVVVVVAGQR